MKITFWGMTSLPMYGNSVEELHLEIDGKHYVVAEGDSDYYVGQRLPKLTFVPAAPEEEVVPCGRQTVDGSGFNHDCQRPVGHTGQHEHRWVDAAGVSRLGLSWTHENYAGDAVCPQTPGAVDVTAKEAS